MARKTFYLDRAQPHPLYKTRMLQAGTLELDASAARLFRKLGVELSDEAPKRAAKAETTETDEAPKPKRRRRKAAAKK